MVPRKKDITVALFPPLRRAKDVTTTGVEEACDQLTQNERDKLARAALILAASLRHW